MLIEQIFSEDFFDELNSKYHFTLDVCATEADTKCERHYSPEEDGLAQEWEGVCWMNPPYGRNVTGKWVKKAVEESQKGCTVVSLLPARTDVAWWHDYVIPYGEITFVRGRLKFGGSKDNAPFPSAVVVFAPREQEG